MITHYYLHLPIFDYGAHIAAIIMWQINLKSYNEWYDNYFIIVRQALNIFKCKVNKKNAETSLNAILKGLITIKTSFYNTKERKKCMSEK